MLLGVPANGLVDCTSALPPPRDNFPGANLPLSAGPAAPSGGPPAGGPPRGAPGPPPGFPEGPRGERPSGWPRGPGKDVAAATSAAGNGYIAPTPAASPMA